LPLLKGSTILGGLKWGEKSWRPSGGVSSLCWVNLKKTIDSFMFSRWLVTLTKERYFDGKDIFDGGVLGKKKKERENRTVKKSVQEKPRRMKRFNACPFDSDESVSTPKRLLILRTRQVTPKGESEEKARRGEKERDDPTRTLSVIAEKDTPTETKTIGIWEKLIS